jgi:RNA-directed DNA polymerase
MGAVLERSNLIAALRQVTQNQGSPGIDGMTVDELGMYLTKHWPQIREALQEGRYRPQSVRRVEIPKPNGDKRKLGIPTVLDRFIQQAVMQVMQRIWDPTFSEASFGFRPKRSAHQAVACAQRHVAAGRRWVVDIDLEKFFERVNHDKLMGLVRHKITDPRVLQLIQAYLKSGVMEGGLVSPTEEGTPQGGPLSPLLSNIMLHELDRELERRGHRFARYADDCNVYVRSQRAGQRVMASLTRFLTRRLKLKVNEAKSAIDRPWKRSFLGFSVTCEQRPRRRISEKSLERLKDRVRQFTVRTRGISLPQLIEELRNYLNGWKNYYTFCEVRSPLKELDGWIHRRLRCYLLKQWGRARYRQLVSRGVSRDLAWNTTKTAHGPWRLSLSPALAFALPGSYLAGLGLPRLSAKPV